MNKRQQLEMLLDEARLAYSGYPGPPHPHPLHFYWQGYVETVEKLLAIEIDDVGNALDDALEMKQWQAGRLSPGASPLQYLNGKVDALRAAQRLFGGDDGGPHS